MGFLLCRQQKQFYTPQHLSGIRRGPPVASCFHPGQGRSMSAQHTVIHSKMLHNSAAAPHTHTHRATHSNGVAQDIYAELFTASHLMNTCCKFSFCLKLSIFYFIAAPNPKPSNNQPDKFASTTNNWLCLWSSYSSKQHRIHKCITKVAFHLLGKTS